MHNEQTLKMSDYVHLYTNNANGDRWVMMPNVTSIARKAFELLKTDDVSVEHLSVEYLINTGLRAHVASKEKTP